MEITDAQPIVDAIKEFIDQIAPDVHYTPKYGGEVFAPYPDDAANFVGGIFVYREHVSLEFTNGATFDDPEGRLEGAGKMRRHLKFRSVEDVGAKNATAFLRQAFSVPD